MKRIFIAFIMGFALVFSATPAMAVVGDGPALQAKTLAPTCVNNGNTKVRVGVKNVGNKSVRRVTVWWKTDNGTSTETVFRFGRSILAQQILPGTEVEFYAYPTKRPNRILLHDTVSSVC